MQCTIVYAPLFSPKELIIFSDRSITQITGYGLKMPLLYFSACCYYSRVVDILKHKPTLCLWKSMKVWLLTLTELDQIWRSVPPTPFLNKWAFYRIMVLECIDWPQRGCTLPSLENVKPVMGSTQWGCDWHVLRAFWGSGCTLLRVLPWWEASCGTPDRPNRAVPHEAQTPIKLHLIWGLVTSMPLAWCQSASTAHEAVCLSAHVSVALNITVTNKSMERPKGFCRDGVSPRKVLMNMVVVCHPHHRLKLAPDSASGWVSVFVALCKEHSNQNHCPGKKIFPIQQLMMWVHVSGSLLLTSGGFGSGPPPWSFPEAISLIAPALPSVT